MSLKTEWKENTFDFIQFNFTLGILSDLHVPLFKQCVSSINALIFSMNWRAQQFILPQEIKKNLFKSVKFYNKINHQNVKIQNFDPLLLTRDTSKEIKKEEKKNTCTFYKFTAKMSGQRPKDILEQKKKKKNNNNILKSR